MRNQFIKLTAVKGGVMLINVDHIIYISNPDPSLDNARVLLTEYDDDFLVKETFSSLAPIIKEYKKD